MKPAITYLLLLLAIGQTFAQTNVDQTPYLRLRPAFSLALCDVDSSVAAKVQPSPAIKSKGKAFLLSLLLPGSGERYAGRPGRARFFLASEITLWLGYAGLITYRDWRSDDYRSYAAANAHVALEGKNDAYFINISNYDDIETYNAAKLRQRNLPAYYRDIEKYYWKWDSAAERKKFDDIRLSAEKADNRALFMLGAVVANHLISAIDAIWSVRGYNKNYRSGVGVEFNMGCTPSGVMVSISTGF